MKKMISQTIEQNSTKNHKNDYTDVSTENSSQHSLDSSFQEKSQSQHNSSTCAQEEYCQSSQEDNKMQDQIEAEQKQTNIQFFKKSIEWLSRRHKRFKIKVQTLYLSISYLIKYIGIASELKYSYEVISAVCLLLASKINEIYVPSIKSILGCLDFMTTKRQILQVQQQLLEIFGFDVGLEKNSYSIVHQIFKNQEEEKRKNTQKLLFLAISNPETLQFGQTYLGLSIVYLLKPQLLANNLTINRDKMKKIAFIVYKMYKQKKNQHSNKSN